MIDEERQEPEVPYEGNQFDERGFQDWYGRWAGTIGLDQNPDAPEHHYDYRAAYQANISPEWDEMSASYHWPSQFKKETHPNRYIDNVDTITGENMAAVWDRNDPELKTRGTFVGGLGALLRQGPSMLTDALPETVGRSIRSGRKTLETGWLDNWIEENRLEGKKAKVLSEEDRKKTWFTMPFTGQKVTYGDAEDAPQNIAYSIANMFSTGAGAAAGMTAGLVLAPTTGGATLPLVGATAGGLIGGTATSVGASKDQFIDIFYEAFKKDFPDINPKNEKLWTEIYKELEQDANLYGLWEAFPETVGNLLTMGIAGAGKFGTTQMAKLGVKSTLAQISERIAAAAGKNLAFKLGVPVAKAGAMLTEEMLTEAWTATKQSAIEAKYGLRPGALSFTDALVEVAPQTLINTAAMGLLASAGTSAASKLTAKGKEQKAREAIQPVIDRWMNEIESNFTSGNINTDDLNEMIAQMAQGNPVRDRLQKMVDDYDAANPPTPEIWDSAIPVRQASEAPGTEPAAPVRAATDEDIVALKTYLGPHVPDAEQAEAADMTPEIESIQRVAAAIGVKTAFFKAPKDTKLNGFNGAYDPQTGTIFVNQKTSKPYLTILGHETFHRMHTEYPDLWEKMSAATDGLATKFEAFLADENAGRQKAGLQPLAADDPRVRYEYMADFAGQQFTNPEFWKKLNEKDPTIAQQIAKIVTELIEKIRKSLRGQKIANASYYRDINAVQDALAETFNEFIRREKKPKSKTIGEILDEGIPEDMGPSDYDQKIAPKEPPPQQKVPRETTFNMDEDTEAHFKAWLDRVVPPEQQADVEKAMRRVLADNPEMLDQGKSWPEIRKMSEAEDRREPSAEDFDKSKPVEATEGEAPAKEPQEKPREEEKPVIEPEKPSEELKKPPQTKKEKAKARLDAYFNELTDDEKKAVEFYYKSKTAEESPSKALYQLEKLVAKYRKETTAPKKPTETGPKGRTEKPETQPEGLSTEQRVFIRQRVDKLGSMENVLNAYPDEDSLVDSFARETAAQVYGNHPSNPYHLNEHGVYTKPETVGIEDTRKAPKWKFKVYLAQSADNKWVYGVEYGRLYGSHEGGGSYPSVRDRHFDTREQALKAGLTQLLEYAQKSLEHGDSFVEADAHQAAMRPAIARLEAMISGLEGKAQEPKQGARYYDERADKIVHVAKGPQGNFSFFRSHKPDKKPGTRMRGIDRWFDTREEAEAALAEYAKERGWKEVDPETAERLRKGLPKPKPPIEIPESLQDLAVKALFYSNGIQFTDALTDEEKKRINSTEHPEGGGWGTASFWHDAMNSTFLADQRARRQEAKDAFIEKGRQERLAEIEVSVPAVDSQGNHYHVKEKADVALAENEKQLDFARRLLECLNS